MSTVTGAFDDYGVADQVVEDLKSSGIDSNKISIFGSRQKDAQTFRSDVYPRDSVYYLVQSILLGAAVGVVVALTSVVLAQANVSLVVGIMAALAGACGGGYVGFMIGAVTRGDVAENDAEIREGNMTKGKIWVGVEAEVRKDELVSQKIMTDLGAIELEPPYEDEPEKKQRIIFTVGWLSSVICVATLFGLSFFSAYGLITASPAMRVLMFLCFSGILLCSIVTSIAGLHTRGARKWLNMEKKIDPEVEKQAEAMFEPKGVS